MWKIQKTMKRSIKDYIFDINLKRKKKNQEKMRRYLAYQGLTRERAIDIEWISEYRNPLLKIK